jgi:lipoyl(octanoyl) transferase
LGLQDYDSTWRAMQQFTLSRHADTADELWLTEHPPVYTQGVSGKPEHLIAPTTIPIIASDRGGQITYHGPGQLLMYCLIDLRRLKLGARQMVTLLEEAVIATLSQYGLKAQSRSDAPGVYVNGQKIASLGLRIKAGCCYHGLSINNAMDLSPFLAINPCGHAGLAMTQLADHGIQVHNHELAVPLVHALLQRLYP